MKILKELITRGSTSKGKLSSLLKYTKSSSLLEFPLPLSWFWEPLFTLGLRCRDSNGLARKKKIGSKFCAAF